MIISVFGGMLLLPLYLQVVRGETVDVRVGTSFLSIEQARKNLLKPPRSYTESAIFKTEGTLKLMRAGAPGLAKEAGEQGKALTTASGTAQKALEGYRKFLREDLLPRSTGT